MSLETRARAAAEGLLTATEIDVDAGLARLRRTHQRRSVARMAGAALAVACVVGGGALVLDATDRTDPAPPSDQQPVDPGRVPGGGIVVHGVEPALASAEAVSLPAASGTPYPSWVAFDPATEWFLYGDEGAPRNPSNDLYVLEAGADAPVAHIPCLPFCSYMHSFGPGPDEITTLDTPLVGKPDTAQVLGFDGVERARIDLSSVLGTGIRINSRGLSDLEWSPDGSQLAVATFEGAWEPGCEDVRNDARVYLFDAAGGDPVLVHREDARPGSVREPPTLHQLAWSADGARLGMVTSRYCTNQPGPPTLVVVDVASGTSKTVHEFEDCGRCRPYIQSGPVPEDTGECPSCIPFPWDFAWSPDGTSIAVTDGDGVGWIPSAGGEVRPVRDTGARPLAWLAPSDG